MKTNLKAGNLFLVVGPSGAGKDTLAQAVINTLPDMQQAISITTRPIRENETDGVHYYFLTKEEFAQARDNDELLEEAFVFGNYYGLYNNEIQDRLDAGNDVMHVIDWQGARDIKQKMDCEIIYIVPNDLKTLKDRLYGRADANNEDAKVVKDRMFQAFSEMAHWTEADYLVNNNDLETATRDVMTIVLARKFIVLARKLERERVFDSFPKATRDMLDEAYYGDKGSHGRQLKELGL